MTSEKTIEYWRALTLKLMENNITTSCINCANFNEQREVCTIVNLRPPAMTIATGCKEWSQGFPF